MVWSCVVFSCGYHGFKLFRYNLMSLFVKLIHYRFLVVLGQQKVISSWSEFNLDIKCRTRSTIHSEESSDKYRPDIISRDWILLILLFDFWFWYNYREYTLSRYLSWFLCAHTNICINTFLSKKFTCVWRLLRGIYGPSILNFTRPCSLTLMVIIWYSVIHEYLDLIFMDKLCFRSFNLKLVTFFVNTNYFSDY